MNRFLSIFLIGAFGGGAVALIIFAVLGVGGLSSGVNADDGARIQAKIAELDARLRSVELNSGRPSDRDSREMTANQQSRQ